MKYYCNRCGIELDYIIFHEVQRCYVIDAETNRLRRRLIAEDIYQCPFCYRVTEKKEDLVTQGKLIRGCNKEEGK